MTKQRKRLGDLLIEAGLLSPLQLDQALQAQQIFGGRLGTNLVEMQVVSDETLAEFLAAQLGVPRATYTQMDEVSPDILALIPAKAAQRLCLLPLFSDGEVLAAAMMDPTEERVTARLELNLKRKIAPAVATEIEIRYFLEKHYGIPREMRHIQLMEQERAHRADPEGIAADLEARIPTGAAIGFFFETIRSLDRVPVREPAIDIREHNLSPSLSYLYHQVDGILNLSDLLSVSPLPRIVTLRALVHLAQAGLIRFEEA